MPKADMGIEILYKDEQIQQTFKDITSRLKDLTPVMRAIGEYLVYATDERFKGEIDPQGVPWKQLSPKTIEQKIRQGRINKILQSTGVMRSRVNFQATSTSVRVGISDRKAVFHQLGIGVPQREIIGLNSENKQQVLNIMTKFLGDVTNGKIG